MAAVEEAFLAECRSEAGLYSHGWAPHCKHFERMRECSPAEMWRGKEHVGKFCFLAHSQSGISVLPRSQFFNWSTSQSLKTRDLFSVNEHLRDILNVCFFSAKIQKDYVIMPSWMCHDNLNISIFDSKLLISTQDYKKTAPQSAFAPFLCSACQQSVSVVLYMSSLPRA